MDLSFSRFVSDVDVTLLPGDLAVLMVGVAARQAASRTALAQAGLTRAGVALRPFAPVDGTFNGPMAARMAQWKQE